jgi:transcriptional repressor NrdR
MRCPFCHADKESLKVIDSRTCDGGRSIRRRRECSNCTKRFTTYERIEENIRLTVVKRDGSRVPWDRNKIITGLERACFKRPVPEGEIMRLADEVEEEIFKSHDREVSTNAIGQLVVDKLRRLDQVAYVRFASVYRQFKTLEELVEEARAVLDAKRFEDPSQGRLFVEHDAGKDRADNGNPNPAAAERHQEITPGAGRHRKPRLMKPAAVEPQTQADVA